MNGNYFYCPRKWEGKGFTRVCLSVRSMAAGGIGLPLNGRQLVNLAFAFGYCLKI